MKNEPMRTLTVSLTPKQADRLQEIVSGGAYASNSEIVRDALRLWEQREELRALEIARLKQAYDEGMASGVARKINLPTMLKRLNSERPKRG